MPGANSTTGTRQQPGLACEECRRRKARCDRVRPRCGICVESGSNCVVVDKRLQRGPKKGQLKDLRSRLIALEQRLVEQGDSPVSQQDLDACRTRCNKASPERDSSSSTTSNDPEMDVDLDHGAFTMFDLASLSSSKMPPLSAADLSSATTAVTSECICKGWQSDAGLLSDAFVPFPAIQTVATPSRILPTSLAAAEPLMLDVVLTELDVLYFERVHPITPMIHKRRYFAWASDLQTSPPRACLRSAMRTVASAMSPQFCDIGHALYASTRRMLETQEACCETGLPWMRSGSPQQHQNIDHERIQAWLLLAYYDILRRSENQALLTARRAFRLLQLSRLLDMDQTDRLSPSADNTWNLSPPESDPNTDKSVFDMPWIAVEEKRRTVWCAFLLDRLSTMLNDQPMMLLEETIYTRLPMPDAEFQKVGQGPASPMPFLVDVMGIKTGSDLLPPFAQCIVITNLFARCMMHGKLAAQETPMSEADSQDFWTRHQWLASAVAVSCKPLPSRCDPMLAFTRVLAYCSSLSLCSTANATPWQTLDHHLMATGCKPAAHKAASEVVRTIQNAPRIAFFKMHPFFPNAIALVARFLKNDVPYMPPTPNGMDSNQERFESITNLTRALAAMSQVNNLATELLHQIELGNKPNPSQRDQSECAWT